MMKETNFGPLLLLLLLAWTPRNSCANPLASPDRMMGGADMIADGITEGANILAAAMNWLQNNTLSSKFDENILELQALISKLPPRLATDRAQILEGLFNSQDRLIQLRSVLRQAATTLKENSIQLIDIYEAHRSSMRLLTYTASKFVNYAKYVNGILEKAKQSTEDIQRLMNKMKALLIDFNAILATEKEKINVVRLAAGDLKALHLDFEKQKKDIDTMVSDANKHRDTVNILTCSLTLGIGCGLSFAITNSELSDSIDQANKLIDKLNIKIEHQNKLLEDLKEGEKLLREIRPAQKSATTLLSHVDMVQNYIATEIDLINNWHVKLGVVILDNDGISVDDIFFNIKGIKENLRNLIKACDDYLNHKLPDIFTKH